MRTIHTILSINDVHSHVDASCELWRELDGARNDQTLVCDAGDFFEGTLFYQQFGGLPELQLMDELVDFACPGNHGFGLLRTYAFTSCKVLCLNVLDGLGRPQFQPDCLFETPMGVFALTGVLSQQAFETIPVQERESLSCTDHIEALEAWLGQLPDKVEGVVVMSHTGLLEDVSQMPEHPALKLVLSAHCHRSTHLQRRDALWCVKAPHHGRGYARVELSPEGIHPHVVKLEHDAPISRLPEGLGALRETLELHRRSADRVLGHWDGAQATPKRAWVARELLRVGLEHGPSIVDVGVLNATCMRRVVPAGRVLAKTLGEMFPFGNTLVYGRLCKEGYDAALEQIRGIMPGHVLEAWRAPTRAGSDVWVLTTSHLWANVFETHGGQTSAQWMSVRQCFLKHMVSSPTEHTKELQN